MANTWDGDFPYRNTRTDGYVGVAPVKTFPPNGYGLYDMAGNVWQWTTDFYRADTHALNLETSEKTNGCCMNPTGPTSTFDPGRPVQNNPERVTKGGSFLCNAQLLRKLPANRPARRAT